MKSVNGSFHEVSCFQFILVFQHKVLLLPHRLLSTASCRLHFSPFTAHRLSSPANPLSPSLTQYIHHATLILLLDHISHTTTTTSTTPECPAQSNTHHAPALLLPDHFHQRLGNMVLHSISGPSHNLFIHNAMSVQPSASASASTSSIALPYAPYQTT